MFVSDEQLKQLYWPTLNELIMAIVDEGLLVWVFTQRAYVSRPHYFKEIPAGTCLIQLESGTDAFRAKEVLGGHRCIEGNVPGSLLAPGSMEAVEAYCTKLAEACGKGSGFKMGFSAFLDEAKPEKVKKMTDVARAYGGAGD